MRTRRLVAGILALTVVAGVAVAKKKKKKEKEPVTQTLPLLQDPPAAVVADPQFLAFRVAPLSSKGLLSQQVRDGLKYLMREARGATIVKLRAFVAGTGDLRRVQTLVSEEFTDRHRPLPALSTIQVGALPGVGVQVVIEAVESQKRPANPHGLAFISGQAGKNIGESLAQIRLALRSQGLEAGRVLQATCFLSSLDSYSAAREAVAQAFPSAAINFAQMQRVPVRTPVECEVVAALDHTPASHAELVNPNGLTKSPDHSQIALVGPGRLVISGIQLGFGTEDKDVRLAFERLQRTLEANQTGFKEVVYARLYPVSDQAAERIRAVRFSFLDPARPPAGLFLPFEALQSLDASFGMEVMAAK